MIKISVIIPIYNVENYIEECLNSIINQTIREIEIIVIDDGSKDNSINIVKKFKDNRIKIIQKENGGLSSARNVGLRLALGEYIYFIDSDDYLGMDTSLEEMYKLAKENDSDIVIGNAIKYYSEDEKYIFQRDKELFNQKNMKSEEFLIKAIKTYSMHSAVCFNMYKKKILIENKLFFKEGYLHEDEDFTPRVFLKANSISIYPENFYIYRFRKDSIIGRKNKKNGEDLLEICTELENIINEIENKELKILLSERTVQLALNTSYTYRLDNVEKRSKDFVVKNSYDKKLKLHSILYKLRPNLYYKFIDFKSQ